MQFLQKLFFLIPLLIWSSAAHAATALRADALNLLSGPVIFKDLERVVPQAVPYFIGIAIIIFTFGLIGRMQKGEFDQAPLPVVLKALLILIGIGTSTTIIDGTLKMADHVADEICYGSSDGALANKVFRIFHTLESAKDSLNGQNPQLTSQYGSQGMADSFIAEKVTSYFDRLIVKCVIACVSALLWVCSWIMVVVETARFFLVQICALISPIFIAGLLTQSFRSQSYNFIFNLIGLILWPIGWAIGHLGTQALFSAASQFLVVEATSKNEVVASSAEAIQQSIANGTYEPGVTTDGLLGMASLGMGPLLCFVLMMLITCFWVVAVTLKAPYIIQKMVSSGSAMFSGVLNGLGGIGQMAGGVVAGVTGVTTVSRGLQAMPTTVGRNLVGGAASLVGHVAKEASQGLSGAVVRPQAPPPPGIPKGLRYTHIRDSHPTTDLQSSTSSQSEETPIERYHRMMNDPANRRAFERAAEERERMAQEKARMTV